jgi:hypothetical protein
MLLLNICQNSQFELRRNLPQDHSQLSLRRAQVLPSISMLWVYVPGIVLHPSNAPRFGVAVVRDIVDMALESPERHLSFAVNAVLRQTVRPEGSIPWSPVLPKRQASGASRAGWEM